MAQLRDVNAGSCPGQRDDGWGGGLEQKHKVFLSHSGAQKAFVEQMCVELEENLRFPFFDKRHYSLPIGENFPEHIFNAIRQCQVGVVILSEEFFMSKWPMMELVAMVEEVENRKSEFKIIPVFFRTSLQEFDNPTNRSRWQSRWHEFLSENIKRVEVGKWEASVRYLRSINGLIYDGLDEVRFQRMIVDAICEVVPAEIRLEDSHIQGRSRMCKEIRNKIDGLQKDRICEVCIVGLYGMGGIGKTSICKALCNEFYTEFRGKVCHAELERLSEEELLRKVLKKLSYTSHERLNELNEDELRNGLKGGIIKEPVFLAVDNMSDTDASIMEAKRYLSARLPAGSIVMVTARSKDSLTRVRPYLSEYNCMEMPELKIEEAKFVFVNSSGLELKNEEDEELLHRCVERCRFLKDDNVGNKCYHYHPLALDVLGRQLGYRDPKEWTAQLDSIDEDIFNQSKENKHPVFSILRKSFDALSEEDQLLFMDVALFLPDGEKYNYFFSNALLHFQWLGMIHGLRRSEDVSMALERLKRKSLLERMGDGKKMEIGMHDLWHAFAVAETKSGKMKRRRWVYEKYWGSGGRNSCCSDLVETSPSGSCWENVMRMAFLDCKSGIFRRINMAHFSNVRVLKISELRMEEELVVDFSGLFRLKSLDVLFLYGNNFVMRGLPRGLIFLSFQTPMYGGLWKSGSEPEEFVKQIECLNELEYLNLSRYGGIELPDMRRLVSLRVARFRDCRNVVTLTGLCPQLKYLRVLDLDGCWELRSCSGVGELKDLEELICSGCESVEGLPDLRKLTKLRKLDVFGCSLISGLPGLDDLVALEELNASGCSELSMLPDMHKLRNLQILFISGCPVEAVPGFDSLISLKEVVADLRNVAEKPSLRELTKLQRLDVQGWSSAGLRGLPNLVMLDHLRIGYCSGVDELPDLRNLVRLQTLGIWECEFEDVSCLGNLSSLKDLSIDDCKKLERLPELQRLTGLESLVIRRCPVVQGRDWIPDLRMFPSLMHMGVEGVRGLTAMSSSGPVTALRWLDVRDCSGLKDLPDLSMFAALNVLEFERLSSLTALRSSGPLTALRRLCVRDCRGLKELPDLTMFPVLMDLEFEWLGSLTALSSSGPLTVLRRLCIRDCSGLKGLPDVRMFPVLQEMNW